MKHHYDLGLGLGLAIGDVLGDELKMKDGRRQVAFKRQAATLKATFNSDSVTGILM
jgi:hypothetical protein